MSLKGLHSKTMRGIVWATAAIKPTDITFLNRVPRKGALHSFFPSTVSISADPNR
jgi:hypothetical protein